MPSLRVLATLLVLATLAVPPSAPRAEPATQYRFAALVGTARRGRWDALPVGECAGRCARALVGTPYVAGTLEAQGPEACRVTLTGLDCMTCVETCLDLARVLARHAGGAPPTFADLRAEVTASRYRGGRVAGYVSRLHYTSEWIAENVARGVLEDVTPALGGERLRVRVGYMSAHPERYPVLRDAPARVDSMRVVEARVNALVLTFVPSARVAAIEPGLRTGDIVAIVTSEAGLDYGHVGLVWRDREGVARFLHASSARHRVVVGERLSAYLAQHPRTDTGISVLRAREVGAGR